MELLQIPAATIQEFAQEGLDLLPTLRAYFVPKFFPQDEYEPNLTWEELLTGIYLLNIPNQDREIRVRSLIFQKNFSKNQN